jgi:hypothetical protein
MITSGKMLVLKLRNFIKFVLRLEHLKGWLWDLDYLQLYKSHIKDYNHWFWTRRYKSHIIKNVRTISTVHLKSDGPDLLQIKSPVMLFQIDNLS